MVSRIGEISATWLAEDVNVEIGIWKNLETKNIFSGKGKDGAFITLV